MSDILDARKVFTDAPESPPVTESVIEKETPDETAQDKGNEPKDGPVDAKGTRFDPSKHQVRGDGTPNTRKDGTFIPKGGRKPKPKAPGQTPSQSILAPDEPITQEPGQATTATDTSEEDQEEPITEGEALATAEGMTSLVWGAAGLALGKDFAPTPEELTTWKGYWKRVALACGLRLPLLLEGIVHTVTAFGRRLTPTDTESRWARFLSWAKGEAK